MKRLSIIILAFILALTGCNTVTKSQNSESIKEGQAIKAQAEDEEGNKNISINNSDTDRLISYNQEEMAIEDIIEKYKEIFEISNSYDEFGTDVYTEGKDKSYSFNYFDTQTSNSVWFSTDIYGNLISFGKYLDNPNHETNKIYTKQEAIEKSRSLLSKLYGKDVAEEFQLDKSTGSSYLHSDYHFLTFVRKVNDVLVPSDYIDIEISKETLDIMNIYINTSTNRDFSDKSYFDDIENIENRDIAYEKFKENNKLYKSFLAKRDRTSNDSMYQKFEYIPVYSLYGIQVPIDAKTLEANFDLSEMSYVNYKSADGISEEAASVEDSYLEDIKNQKTAEEAEKKARDLFKLDNDYKLNWSNFANYNSIEGVYIWDLSFNNNDEEYVNVTLLANDLTLVQYNKSVNNISKYSNEEVSHEEAIKLAQNFITSKGNLKLDELEITERSKIGKNNLDNKIEFLRKVGDQEYLLSDNIQVGFLSNSKEIAYYSRNWDYKFEKPEFSPEISEDEVFDILDKVYNFDLVYKRIISEDGSSKVKLFYEYIGNNDYSGDKYIVDPSSKLVIDEYGYQVKFDFIKEYDDIDQALYPDIIKELAENDIGFFDGQLRPKDVITEIEFFKILARSSYSLNSISNMSQDEIYEYIINQGILREWDDRRPDKEVTQSDLAKYFVRINNLEKIADMNNIYKEKYKDIDGSNKDFGYLVLAKELGFISTESEDLLEPSKKIDRETALYSFYKYIMDK